MCTICPCQSVDITTYSNRMNAGPIRFLVARFLSALARTECQSRVVDGFVHRLILTTQYPLLYENKESWNSAGIS